MMTTRNMRAESDLPPGGPYWQVDHGRLLRADIHKDVIEALKASKRTWSCALFHLILAPCLMLVLVEDTCDAALEWERIAENNILFQLYLLHSISNPTLRSGLQWNLQLYAIIIGMFPLLPFTGCRVVSTILVQLVITFWQWPVLRWVRVETPYL